MTVVQQFVPDGASLPSNPLLNEDLEEQYRLRIEVAPSGVIISCEQTQRDGEVATNRSAARSRCQSLTASSSAVFEPITSATVRAGEIMDAFQADTD
jgi:hypothetical protein